MILFEFAGALHDAAARGVMWERGRSTHDAVSSAFGILRSGMRRWRRR